MRYNAEIHKPAIGMTLVQVVSKSYSDEVQDYWLDPDGIHLHAVWDITKAGAPDKRKRPQSLLRRAGKDYRGNALFVGHYILATPKNLARLRLANDEIRIAREAMDAAVERRDASLSINGGAA